jgi:hypothetical protein
MNVGIGDVLILLAGGLILVAIGLFLGAVAQDARRRGKPPMLVALLVLMTFPLGLLIWIVFRPEVTGGSGGVQPFRLDDYRLQ